MRGQESSVCRLRRVPSASLSLSPPRTNALLTRMQLRTRSPSERQLTLPTAMSRPAACVQLLPPLLLLLLTLLLLPLPLLPLLLL